MTRKDWEDVVVGVICGALAAAILIAVMLQVSGFEARL